MRRYRLGVHTKTDLKVHLIWIPKYRKRVLVGPVAIRVRDILRQIAMEHELEVITGKVSVDHVHMFIGYRPTHSISKIVQWLKGDQFTGNVAGVCTFKEALLGPAFLGTRIYGSEFGECDR